MFQFFAGLFLVSQFSFASATFTLDEAKQFLETSASKKVELLKAGQISIEEVFDLFQTLKILNRPNLQNDLMAGQQILVQLARQIVWLQKRSCQPADRFLNCQNTNSTKGNLLTVLNLLCARNFSETELERLHDTIDRIYHQFIDSVGRPCQMVLLDPQTLSTLTDLQNSFMTVFDHQKLMPIL